MHDVDFVDKPITAGKDPIALAKSLAEWVKKNNMAGVDIDLEDNEAMNNHIFIPWIVGKYNLFDVAITSTPD
jgi:hypothetical protein